MLGNSISFTCDFCGFISSGEPIQAHKQAVSLECVTQSCLMSTSMVRHYLLGTLFTCIWNTTVVMPLWQTTLNSTDQCTVLLWEHTSNSATVAIKGSKPILRKSYQVAVKLRVCCLIVIHGMIKTLGNNLFKNNAIICRIPFNFQL